MAMQLTATILTENAPVEGLRSEHGLSVHLAYGNRSVLLDFGQSDAFARNATMLGINLASVDSAMLSHAHYDHADGMETFFAVNTQAPLYLSEACGEDCWSTKAGTTEAHYIGIKQGLLSRFESRLRRMPRDRISTIVPGVHLVPHTTPGLSELGARAGMLRRHNGVWMGDDFAHEMSLVIELASGSLAIFSSCSHAGPAVIVSEVLAAFPGARIAAYVGGLHLVHASKTEILQVADVFRSAGVESVFTGHCTGEAALSLLAQALPNRVTPLHPGLTFTL